MRNENPRDLTDPKKFKSNLTMAIQNDYQRLMSIMDPDELKSEAIALAEQFVGAGLSDKNHARFVETLNQVQQKDGLVGLQMYLSNYMMAGSGLSVGRGLEHKNRFNESIEVERVANLITESVDDSNGLTKWHMKLISLVENNTNFVVTINN